MAENTNRQAAVLYLKILLGISCIFAAPFAVASFFASRNDRRRLSDRKQENSIARLHMARGTSPLQGPLRDERPPAAPPACPAELRRTALFDMGLVGSAPTKLASSILDSFTLPGRPCFYNRFHGRPLLRKRRKNINLRLDMDQTGAQAGTVRFFTFPFCYFPTAPIYMFSGRSIRTGLAHEPDASSRRLKQGKTI